MSNLTSTKSSEGRTFSQYFDIEDEVFDTVLEENITFTGNINFTKPFMIRGRVSGEIVATSDLVLDSSSTVTADVNVSRLLIKGRLTGNVSASELVFVSSTGTLTGDVTTKQLVLEPGSTFSGKCTMRK